MSKPFTTSESLNAMTRPRVVVGVLLAALAVLASLLMSGAAASAADKSAAQAPVAPAVTAAYPDYYGAISLAYTGGAVGWSYDYATKRKAKKAAQRACRARSDYPGSCHKIAWVRNGCLALAVRWDSGNIDRYGWAVRRTKKAAYRVAKRECGWGCVRRASTCTSR